ncbi:hypothetical protein FALBO_4103 [Fusarium albosuccineum]|uniref:GAT domain-containing protein n=1 Tax=Fusarium albosuccineum TaxID=1237068 RepID=A0A8H4PGN4_9HYPO|nr:hypothetical protein FALBO_4103 [Fusarium albosuccineum]
MKSLKGLGYVSLCARKAANPRTPRPKHLQNTSADDATLVGTPDGPSGSTQDASTPAGSPEATAHNSVKAFCESGGKSKVNTSTITVAISNDEVLFLPPIVDAAESSPAAAAECARLIRKYLSKEYLSRPPWQYNAIMLMRILTDNPGSTFTRNIDQKFVDTARQLLKGGRDPSVRQILMETLDDFERTKVDDENLALIVSMWKKEKEKAYKDFGAGQPPNQMMMSPPPPGAYNTPPANPHSQNYFARHHTNRRLPDPVELASRLEEARTSAKLLEQVVMNTPPGEILDNDLIKEFADRCSSASRSIQGYMVSEDPTPDNDTMENLIDTNEQLQTALNQHKRAVLNSRKQLGLGERTDSHSPSVSPQPQLQPNGSDNHFNDQASSSGSGNYPGPSRNTTVSGKGKEAESYLPPPGPPPNSGQAQASSSRALPDQPVEDPFADPKPAGTSSHVGPSATDDYLGHERLAFEPFHPGFKPTESYLGRQDSAVGKVQMHGAGTSTPSNQPPQRQRLDEVSDDDDIYDAPNDAAGKSKDPMYRY